MKAMIMAAGVGSRLMPLTVTMPKPMVPIVGKPVMEYGVKLLKEHGITEIAANLHYLPEAIKEHFGNGLNFGVNIKYSYEEKLLGTAGGVKNNQCFLGGDAFIVLSGDALTDINLAEMYQYHKQKGALATIALKPVMDVTKFGVVVLDDNNQIARFQEKPQKEEALSNLANTGIYIFEPEVFAYIPAGEFFDFGKDLFPFLVKQKLPFYGWQTGCYWSDIGSFQTYKEAQFDILKGMVKVSPWAEGTQGDQTYLGVGATIGASTELTGYVVIGKNTSIGQRCIIHNSIILENVQINDDVFISNSVIGNGCRINSKVTINSDCVLAEENILAEQAELLKGVKVWPGKYIGEQELVDRDLVG